MSEEILNIGKYTLIHGNSRATRKYSIGESTVRLHQKKYEQDLTSSTKVKRRRPLQLGSEINEKIMKYLHTIRKKGGVVNTVVAIAIAHALIAKSEDKNVKVLDLEKTSWTKSVFHQMRFVKRSATNGKPVIPDGAKKEAGLLYHHQKYHHQIIMFVEEHDIPSSLVMNFDQTPLKYAPVSSQTLAKQGSKYVSISGATYRTSLTATFGISLHNKFLPIQLIYGGKTQ